ncbi:uncharacterized protein TNCV_3761101 [Trichonephila clavipes]|nr:uncharacterized protein TNCV_3761101 [Trichonephila clavipes]
MEADNIDCELVQEPHSYRSTLPGYPNTYRLFYDPNSDIIKAAIIVRSRHLSTFIDYKNSDYNMVTLESMDSNSKSELWFSPYSDARGNKLSEFISANNLFIINEDCGPTFRATQGTSYIDITVVGSDLLEDNSSWCLSENESLSDHVMIDFEFCLSTVLRDTSSAPFASFLGFGSLPRISWYLRRGDFLSSDQYGFTPHKNTEDALLRLNEIVKRGKKKHLHSILISLDIKGAFDNAWWPCILNLLKKAEIPINIFSLVADFLNDRVAKMQLGSTSAIRCLERGCPQGSVSGRIFWNIIINDLLSKLNNLACCEIIAFADDILVCSQGRDISETFLH